MYKAPREARWQSVVNKKLYFYKSQGISVAVAMGCGLVPKR
jgi:hypothetical protein